MEIYNKKTDGWGLWHEGPSRDKSGFLHGAGDYCPGGYLFFSTEPAAETECARLGLSATHAPRKMRITETVEAISVIE